MFKLHIIIMHSPNSHSKLIEEGYKINEGLPFN